SLPSATATAATSAAESTATAAESAATAATEGRPWTDVTLRGPHHRATTWRHAWAAKSASRAGTHAGTGSHAGTGVLELLLDLSGGGAHSGTGRAGLTWSKSAGRAGTHAGTGSHAGTPRVESIRNGGVSIRHCAAMGRIMHPPVAIADDGAIEV